MTDDKRPVYQYGRRSTDLSNKKKRLLAIVILITMIAFTSIILLYSYLTQTINKSQQAYIETSINSSFNGIENYIGELSFNASQKASNLAQDIETEIRTKYPDLDVLKKEMSKKDYSDLDELISLVVSDKMYLNGVENNRNSVFVTTNKDIIFNPDYDSITNNNKDKYETWEEFINTNYNKDLANNAYHELATMPDSYIFIEPYRSDFNDHIYYRKVDIHTLRSVYEKEGIEGLKNYQLLVPAYIKNTKDIFDSPEISVGVKQDTYRLIVIQRCNIYDQIMENKPYLAESSTEDLIKNKDNLLTLAYVIGIFIVIIFLAFISFGIMLFNNFVIGKQESPIINRDIKNK